MGSTHHSQRYFIKWKNCDETKNIWKPIKNFGTAKPFCDNFIKQNGPVFAINKKTNCSDTISIKKMKSGKKNSTKFFSCSNFSMFRNSLSIIICCCFFQQNRFDEPDVVVSYTIFSVQFSTVYVFLVFFPLFNNVQKNQIIRPTIIDRGDIFFGILNVSTQFRDKW